MIARLGTDLFFPPSEQADPSGLLAYGGDLSVERLLLAYRQGIFPWYDAESPLLWWSPPERALLAPSELRINRTLQKQLRAQRYSIAWDTRFAEVIHSCATAKRAQQEGTWIVPEMRTAYKRLHQAGYAHSVEVYENQALVGGLYGVSLGHAFFGESMFSLQPNASKIAFVALAQQLQTWGFAMIDCQWMNPHVQQLGAYLVPRQSFLAQLDLALRAPTRLGPWCR